MIGVLSGILWNIPVYFALSIAMFISLRICKFPDFTTDGSYVLGMAGLYVGVTYFGQSAILGLALAILFGCLAGLLTGAVYSYLLTPEPLYKLLAGLLVMFSTLSVTFRALGNQESQGLRPTIHELNALRDWELSRSLGPWRPISILIIMALLTGFAIFLSHFLRSNPGLLLRTAGERPQSINILGKPQRAFLISGLILSNATVAIAGWIYGALNNTVNYRVPGTIVDALGALLIGEAIMDSINARRRIDPGLAIVACAIGAVAYSLASGIAYTALNSILRKGAFPQDHKLVVSVIILITLLFTRRRNKSLSPSGEADLV